MFKGRHVPLFLVKKREMFEGFYNIQFGSKTQSKKTKCIKLSTLQNGYLRILIFLTSIPITQYLGFSNIKAYKIQNFGVIQTTGIYVV